jgi:hypothetical protein
VESILSFEDFDKLNLSNIVKYESFTHAGRKDGNGIEKKFSHIDTRQLHSMDLGFQLLPEDMGYDYYPNPQSLSLDLPEEYVVLHITSNWANRTWNYQNWVNLIEWLKQNQIFTVLIGAGYREELHHSYSDKPLDKECPMFDDYYGLDLTNKGTMSDMWWVINGSKCLITMDSGPLHLAGTTDVEIIQLGSAINPKFRAPYRNGTQDYKYYYLGGTCNIFCNSNLFYNVKEWGDINSVPPQPNCLENKPTFECHPSVNDVIRKVSEILEGNKDLKYLSFIEFIPSEDINRINFNYTKTTNQNVNIVAVDVKTGLTRDTYVHHCKKLDEGYYWWTPMPGSLKDLGDVDLLFYLDGEYYGKKRLHFAGGYDLIIKGKDFHFDFSRTPDYPTLWEIFINNDYSKIDNCRISEGDVVLDIGGNSGFFALYSLQEGASKIYSVEPVDTSFDKIVKLSEIFSEIVPINKAISETDGNVTMFVDEGSSATNCLTHYAEMFDKTGEYKIVQSININNLISEIPEKINLMKVDCEGAEFELFKSISDDNLKLIDKMIIETHGSVIDEFVQSRLRESNFEIYKHNNILFAINLFGKK